MTRITQIMQKKLPEEELLTKMYLPIEKQS